MGRRLVSMSDGGGIGFSPFVDVAINGMAAMFVFLAVYVAVVPPPLVPELRVLTTQLPEAAWRQGYQTGIAVTGGMGSYRLTLHESRKGVPREELIGEHEAQVSHNAPQTVAERLSARGLFFDTRSGRLSGNPRPSPDVEAAEAIEKFSVVVSDASGQRAIAHLELKIKPKALPFDPDDPKLRLALEEGRLLDAWVGQEYRCAVAALGGIEEYEFAFTNLPGGLKEDPKGSGVIAGKPAAGAVPPGNRWKDYKVEVEVRDRQSDFFPEAVERLPVAMATYTLRVRALEPIDVASVLPYGRPGFAYRGAVVAWGGMGDLTLSIVRSELPSFRLEHGILQGPIPRDAVTGIRPVVKTIDLVVRDEDPKTEENPFTQRLSITILPPMRVAIPGGD